MLDAGCGTGALTIALYEAFERKSMAPRTVDAFDLTPAMLHHLHEKLRRRGISLITTTQANVLQLDQLPPNWTDYHLATWGHIIDAPKA